MSGATARLIRAELALMRRDQLVLTFVVAFPIVTDHSGSPPIVTGRAPYSLEMTTRT